MEASGPIVSAQVDKEYGEICSRIGEQYIKRAELLDQVRVVNAQLEVLKLQRAQAVAKFHALQFNESLVQAAPAHD